MIRAVQSLFGLFLHPRVRGDVYFLREEDSVTFFQTEAGEFIIADGI